MGARRRIRRWRRWVQNPVVTIVLLAVIVVDLLLLPGTPPRSTVVGSFVHREVRGHARSTYRPFQVQVFVLLDRGRPVRVVDPDRESWDELATIVDERPEDLAIALYAYNDSIVSGAYAPTRVERTAALRLYGIDSEDLPPTVDREAIRDAVASHFATRRDLEAHSETVAQGDVLESRILWAGVVHNVASLAALVLLAVSLGWIPRAPAWIRSCVESRARARGRCPSCGYPIHDLDRCPECGRAIPTPPDPGSA